MTILRLILAGALLAGFASAAMQTDIEFAKRPDGNLTLDAWIPDGPGPHAAVIIVHGGGWINGDKQTYVKPLFPVLTDAGFAWFTINYRLAPKHHFPENANDVEDAVRWVKANAKKFNVDPKRIALTGESAGGHLVSWIGVTKGRELGLAAVIPIYAPHDLLGRAVNAGKVSENVQKLLSIGPELTDESKAALRKASPYYFVRKGLPPFLMIHGTKDAQVPYEQSPAMQKKLQEAGVSCDLYTVEGGAHGMGSWAKVEDGWKSYLSNWLGKTLNPKTTTSAARR